MSKLIHAAISNKVLGAAFAVHGALGSGLLESAYEGALVVEFKHKGVSFERQKVFPLEYRGEYIGAYIADVVVENTVIVELKSITKSSKRGPLPAHKSVTRLLAPLRTVRDSFPSYGSSLNKTSFDIHT
jgi:GxxExxY protein